MLVCNDRRITFSELDINANRLANAYTDRGLTVGDRIAMLLPNSAELIEAMCGAAKAGGVGVMIAATLSVRLLVDAAQGVPPLCTVPAGTRPLGAPLGGTMPLGVATCHTGSPLGVAQRSSEAARVGICGTG